MNLSEEEAERILNLSGKSTHSAWLTFMLPRLILAKDLLTDDGVILISIDDNEQSNLKVLCDNVWGEENFIGQLILQTATDNNPTQVNTEHEYMLIFAKNKESVSNWKRKSFSADLIKQKYLKLKELHKADVEKIQKELRKWIKDNKDELPQVTHYDNVDENGVFHDGDIANTKFGGYEYEIIHPLTKKSCKIPDKGFRYPKETLLKMIKDNNVLFGKDETVLIKPKKRLENATELLRSVIYEDGRTSSNEVNSLIGRDVFKNPKSHHILTRILDFITTSEDIILDFFSGSGSTAHNTGDDVENIQGQSHSYNIEKLIPYNEFLILINKNTNIPIQLLHKSIIKFNEELENQINEGFFNADIASSFIIKCKEWKKSALSKYEYKKLNIQKTETALTDEKGLVKEEIVSADIGVKLLSDLSTPNKFLYDLPLCDSPLEGNNLKYSDNIEEVVVFGKIPRRSVKIPLYFGGTYSPDFMYVLKDKDGLLSLNCIIETKDVKTDSDKRKIEEEKIECARVFYEKLTSDFKDKNIKIVFEQQLKNKDIASLLTELQNR